MVHCVTQKLFTCEITPELEFWSLQLGGKKKSECPVADLLFGQQSILGLLQEWQNCGRCFMAAAEVSLKRGIARDCSG